LPFGEDIFVGVGGRTGDTGQRYSSSADDVRQKFTGYQKDAETNLDFAEARMYENRYGRFTAIDPLLASGKSADPQTFNRYVYVGNSPLVITDTSGMIGDYFSYDGKYLGHDFKNDGKIYFATEIDRTRNGKAIVDRRSIKETTIETVLRTQNAAVPLTTGNEYEAIHTLAAEGVQAASDTAIGTLKGIGNSPVHLWNGLSQPGGPLGGLVGVPNPFSVTPFFTPSNAREAVYENAGSTGIILGTTFAAAPFSGSRALSVVPEEIAASFPPIKLGSTGGPTAFGKFSKTDKLAELEKNPNRICVFCRQEAEIINFDHAEPRSLGGNTSPANIQITCQFCNLSKGARPFPVNPASGYVGPFPPPWWKRQ
jgi:RHS repeat-associated protein